MKSTLACCILLTLLILNCKSNGDMLTFEPTEYVAESCGNCPKTVINIPKVLDKKSIGSTINNAIREEVISLLIYDDETEAATIEEAMDSFKNGYLELKKLYPDEPVGWEANIEASVTYEDKNIISIQINSYSFTGGAHGFSSTRFLNFDKKKNKELETMELFKDPLGFENFVEDKFRKQENIPATSSINATGFMFENDQFYLPLNIGFTAEGLKLFYEQYEVTSYAEGPITLTLPFAEIRHFLNVKLEI
ncbi:DUF3298/DUF4163 domain-containing protein [Arenibacter aquaticus]|uniref:DUF3298/DUF4163 domain-containing protein n=1 Tax=Arenibacter aquaticus TaxID=2489054 RepID=A0A430K6F3_9FLAO|nr:DUF3298/DUF4163 domain-containing protein [Arenibacter aquaticus]